MHYIVGGTQCQQSCNKNVLEDKDTELSQARELKKSQFYYITAASWLL